MLKRSLFILCVFFVALILLDTLFSKSDFQETGGEVQAQAQISNHSPEEVLISCELERVTPNMMNIQIEIENTSGERRYIFDNESRMPYLILHNGDIFILQGIHPFPNPNILAQSIRLPRIRSLEPGEILRRKKLLQPFRPMDIYQGSQTRTFQLYGTYSVQCLVGWGETKIEQIGMPLTDLLEWQNITASEAMEVDFGNRFLEW